MDFVIHLFRLLVIYTIHYYLMMIHSNIRETHNKNLDRNTTLQYIILMNFLKKQT